MAKKYTDEFRRHAVRMATTSGLTRPQLSSDLGVGLSTLNKWVNAHRDTDARRESWIGRKLASKPKMLVGIAQANKMAHQIWAMLMKNEDYRDLALAAA